ncbi:MAG: type IV pilus modification PilV family protein [Planctomycetota bacterium]|jgi:type II secretory pathway pseudopilin PulG
MKNKTAFTLVEILVAIILVGLAVMSLVATNVALTRVNGAGVNLSTAEFVLEQARELLTMAPYDDLVTYDEITYSPPKAADGNDLSEFPGFSQEIIVENVDEGNYELVVGDGITDFSRITVTVKYNSGYVCAASWIRAKLE